MAVFFYGNLTIFLPCDSYRPFSEKTLTKFYAFLQFHQLYAYISFPYENITESHIYYKQAAFLSSFYSEHTLIPKDYIVYYRNHFLQHTFSLFHLSTISTSSENVFKDSSAFILFAASPIPAAYMPPFFAASIPASASSTTIHAFGGNPKYSAAFKNTSGSGFDFVILFPSEIASKASFNSTFSRINFAFLLDDPIANLYPFLEVLSMYLLLLLSHRLVSLTLVTSCKFRFSFQPVFPFHVNLSLVLRNVPE